MRYGGRVQGAIEVLEDVLLQHTPATTALRDWGKAHRFAGSKDRSAIGAMVHDALRLKSSILWRMDTDDSRSLVIGLLVFVWGDEVAFISEQFEQDGHSPEALSDAELILLEGKRDIASAPEWIQADIPEWIWPSFENNYGEHAIDEGRALTKRPPLDLRVNTLKKDRASAREALSEFNVEETALSPIGLRITAGPCLERLPNIQSEPSFLMGDVEIQDEGSQIVSLLTDAKPGEKVLDYCAGGGGKTLALAAMMENQGTVYAYDIDKRRLAPLYQRAMRAGAENIKICQPPVKSLENLVGKMDRVLVDAPCTGSGTWRRKPDAKWRLSEDTLLVRMQEQKAVLSQAQAYVKPGGIIIYVTCSMFAEENEGQVYKFLDSNKDFELLSAGEVFEDLIGEGNFKPWSEDGCTVTLTPASTHTDGFFFSVMQKKA
jgi:16S rRNA (cytosine967-C5)-methyltransferase